MIDQATPPLLEVHVPVLEKSKAEREYEAFRRLLPQLLATHGGKFVAIHDEKVVDADADDIALVQRVHAKFGYVPIHVGLVQNEQPVARLRLGRCANLPRNSVPELSNSGSGEVVAENG
jgi:hypothetical protein